MPDPRVASGRLLARGALLALAALLLPTAASGARLADAARLQAERTGHVRVFVALQPSTPTPRADAANTRAVQAGVDRVLAHLPDRGTRVRRRFAHVDAVALDVDRAGLARLQADPGVRSIDLDAAGGGHAVAPDEASVLNGVASLAGVPLDGAGQVVAVVDSGVATQHADLRARLLDETCFCSINAGSGGCCPNGTARQDGPGSAQDDNGHGTNVSGIIVGEGHVAPRGALPAARLVAVKVLDSANRFCCTSDIVAALDWIVQAHPEVSAVNMSLGTDALFPGDCDGATAYTQALTQAIGALASHGIVVTASSGNQGNASAMSVPACVRAVVSVGATWDADVGAAHTAFCDETSTAAGRITCFSNRSATTDLFAAGAFVTSTGRSGGTSTYYGTSQAAPMVAACAAALDQAAPAATGAQRIDAMTLSPKRVADAASGRTYPFLDCMDAVGLLAPALSAPVERACSGSPVPGAPPVAASPVVSNVPRLRWRDRAGVRRSD